MIAMIETVTETVFNYLTQIGFTHPLHPTFTHIPMGLMLGAIVFRFCSVIPPFKGLAKSAYHCLILGFFGLILTILSGILDWQHTYGGQWEEVIIIKMVLASFLAILMFIIAIKDQPENPGFNRVTAWYFLTIVLIVGLGFLGGELVYKSGVPA